MIMFDSWKGLNLASHSTARTYIYVV